MKNATFGLLLAASAALALTACGGAPEANPAEASAMSAPKGPETSLPTGDAAAGEKLAKTKMGAAGQACEECHGPHGNQPNAPDRPKIGGQYSDYIAHALQSYRAGQRTNPIMAGQAKNLTDQQIEDLAAYFGSQDGQLEDLSHIEAK